MKYPATFTAAKEGGFVVTFRDIPECVTQGDDEADALFMAQDALVCAMDFYFEDKRSVPAPSKAKKGERLIELPLSIAAKVLLLNTMLETHVKPAELARRLDTSRQEINRLINLKHTTKIDRIAEAMGKLGKHLELIAA
ncbi:MAG: type II toxin-antitoxin system HicB family antitoxin [Burkholderiales bacterium]|nr:type II toxin-antitoxin system HicB family antitoxin [Burkholderiales bacterium]